MNTNTPVSGSNSKLAESIPPRLNVTVLPSTSVATNVPTAVVFSTTEKVSLDVNTGSLSFAFVTLTVIFCSVVFFLLSSAYFAYGWLMQVGIDQGYMPIQPIHYSHKIHSGANQIDCQ